MPQNITNRLKQWYAGVKISPFSAKTAKQNTEFSLKSRLGAPVELSSASEEKFTEAYLAPILEALLDELNTKLNSLDKNDLFDYFLDEFLIEDNGDANFLEPVLDLIEFDCCQCSPFMIDQLIKRCVGPCPLNPTLVLGKSFAVQTSCYSISETLTRVTRLLHDLRHY